jgi:parallel beta-helix repeat protein
MLFCEKGRVMVRYRSHSKARPLLRSVVAIGLLTVGLGLVTDRATAASSEPGVGCGSIVTTDLVLDHDLLDCAGAGLIVGADAVAIDLGDHIIDGDGGGDDATDIGIDVGQFDGVAIRGGTVREFYVGLAFSGSVNSSVEATRIRQSRFGVSLNGSPFSVLDRLSVADGFDGITLSDSDHSRVERSSVEGQVSSGVVLIHGSDINRVVGNTFGRNGFTGVTMDGTSGNLVRRNRVTQSEVGILPFNSVDTVVTRNRASDNEVGIAFFGTSGGTIDRNVVDSSARDGLQLIEGATGALVSRNVVQGSDDDGIDVDVPGNTLAGNRTDENLDFGIEAVSGTIDGGGNRAAANGAAGQCIGITCR